MKLRVVLGCLAAAMVFAQSPTDVFEKAPPEIEKALRDRVAIFFQAHVDGKFRRAEQVIKEDCLDDFYNSEKTRLISFEISRINWSDNFTKATVVTDVELDWVTSRGKFRVKPPMKSFWVLDKGQWWWYIQKRDGWETPWGVMKSADQVSGSGGAGSKQLPTAAATPIHIPDAQEILNQIKADKSEILLSSSDKTQADAGISSEVPGKVTLSVMPYTVAGLTVKLDKQVVNKGETAHVSFSYDPPNKFPKAPVIVYVEASPLKKVFTFTLVFSPPTAQAPQTNLPPVRVR